MRGGQLRHWLTFQLKTETVNFGSVLASWADDFEMWGAYEPLGSREFPAAQKRHAQTTCRFRVRYDQRIVSNANFSDAYRIAFTLDASTSPVIVQYFDLYPALPKKGKRAELLIEAYEIK